VNINFRHIHSIGFSIVDFYCASARLAIIIAEKPNRACRTGIRHEDFKGMPGLRVLEFSHEKVLENTEAVLRIIERELYGLDPYFEKDSIRFKGSQLKRVPRRLR
jgi:very-short-patch-repair endonuclease